ncbi:ABC transporter ATP-binding protein [Paenibacillus anaericanus]|uniref:Carnitine transport ATP-binding protein OpuCA n=1 Tax=Paenibacillus anaericanus TaxID=170367 RepID=A0A3S1DFP7_9BACL|nr:ABC transporter ATP-binding protein [Paenibacillus anaericanus]RUT43859.1 ABC transporter ATP-binding protein [Paenibacillus anaericanus]
MSYLQLAGITKRFGGNTVLDNIHLSAVKGEMITLLGPSGCGKSTLLRCISGLTEIEAGSVVLEERELTSLAPRDREVGMVFQSYGLFPNLSVSENIGYGLKMKGIKKEQRTKSVNELLELVDLSEKHHAYPHELSGGQQQRVALARSLAMQPKLMLLDEPLSALDAKIRKNLRMEIRQLQKRLMMTMIFVTHDQEEALMISDRICVMRNGVIVQEGSPEQIYSAPRTEFVARFIGNYNVLEPEQAARLAGLAKVPDISYAIRPESIILLPGEGMPSTWNGSQEFIAATTLSGYATPPFSGGDIPLYWTGKVVSMTMLGNILRYSVESEGVLLSVDILAGQGTYRPSEQSEVTLCVYTSQCIPLEKDGA